MLWILDVGRLAGHATDAVKPAAIDNVCGDLNPRAGCDNTVFIAPAIESHPVNSHPFADLAGSW